jgi:hypothetical protein
MESEYYMLYQNKAVATQVDISVSCTNFGFDSVSCFENGCHMFNGQCTRECDSEEGCIKLADYDFNIERARTATCPMYQDCQTCLSNNCLMTGAECFSDCYPGYHCFQNPNNEGRSTNLSREITLSDELEALEDFDEAISVEDFCYRVKENIWDYFPCKIDTCVDCMTPVLRERTS